MVIGCNQDREGVSVIAFTLKQLRRACLLLTMRTTAFLSIRDLDREHLRRAEYACEFRDGPTYDDGTASWLSMFGMQ